VPKRRWFEARLAFSLLSWGQMGAKQGWSLLHPCCNPRFYAINIYATKYEHVLTAWGRRWGLLVRQESITTQLRVCHPWVWPCIQLFEWNNACNATHVQHSSKALCSCMATTTCMHQQNRMSTYTHSQFSAIAVKYPWTPATHTTKITDWLPSIN